MNEIRCITDQLLGFAQEVENSVTEMIKRGYTKDQAIKIVEIAVEDIKAEVGHQRNRKIDEFIEVYTQRTGDLTMAYDNRTEIMDGRKQC